MTYNFKEYVKIVKIHMVNFNVTVFSTLKIIGFLWTNSTLFVQIVCETNNCGTNVCEFNIILSNCGTNVCEWGLSWEKKNFFISNKQSFLVV